MCDITKPTGVAAPVAHIGRDETPFVCEWVVKLDRGEVTGAVVPSDHIQQPVNGTNPWSEDTVSPG